MAAVVLGATAVVWNIVRPNTLLGNLATGVAGTALGFLVHAFARCAARHKTHLVIKLEKPIYSELGPLFNVAFDKIKTHQFYESFKHAMAYDDGTAKTYFWVNLQRGACYGFMIHAMRALEKNGDPKQIRIDPNDIIYHQLLQFMWGAFIQLGTEDGRKSFQVDPPQLVLDALPAMADAIQKELTPWDEIKGDHFIAQSSAEVYNNSLVRLAGTVSTFSGHIDIYGNAGGHSIAFFCTPEQYLIADSWEFFQYRSIGQFHQALRDRILHKIPDCIQATFYIRK